jgi:hypothetical protein
MRDPDLVVRAQRAATALESAWCRWRNVHGLTTDPPPAVSSYVGYSLDAPWGEGRIVFGICAEEAEHLAELLEHHDCVGPIHASVTAKSVDGPGSTRPDSATIQPGAAGLLHVPAPSPASAGQQPLAASATGSRNSDLLAPRSRGPARSGDEASPLTAPRAPAAADGETPIARAVSRALGASHASARATASETAAPAGPQRLAAGLGAADRPGGGVAGGPAGGSALDRVSGPWAADRPGRRADWAGGSGPGGRLGRAARPGGPGPDTDAVAWPPRPGGADDRPAPEDAEAAGVPEVAAFRYRRPADVAGRPLPGAVTPADPAGRDDTVQTPVPVRPPDGRDRVISAARHADAAAWSASEVPGQAAVTDPAL